MLFKKISDVRFKMFDLRYWSIIKYQTSDFGYLTLIPGIHPVNVTKLPPNLKLRWAL
jgi:hypothetical protein